MTSPAPFTPGDIVRARDGTGTGKLIKIVPAGFNDWWCVVDLGGGEASCMADSLELAPPERRKPDLRLVACNGEVGHNVGRQ